MKKILIAGLLGSLALVPQLASANGFYGYHGGYGYHYANPWPFVAGAVALGAVTGAIYAHPNVVVAPQPVYAPPPVIYGSPAPYSYAPYGAYPYTCTYYPNGARVCN